MIMYSEGNWGIRDHLSFKTENPTSNLTSKLHTIPLNMKLRKRIILMTGPDLEERA